MWCCGRARQPEEPDELGQRITHNAAEESMRLGRFCSSTKLELINMKLSGGYIVSGSDACQSLCLLTKIDD